MVQRMTFIHEDDNWSDNWEPNSQTVAWFANLMRMLADGAVWAVPGTSQVYRINHKAKTLTLVHGDAADPNHWHDKTKKTLAKLGYTVLDAPAAPEADGEHAFAESRVSSAVARMTEDIGSPFKKKQAILQYRPFATDGTWHWFWVLLPEDGGSAIATGQGVNRAEAATAARLEARRLGVSIRKIDILRPHADA